GSDMYLGMKKYFQLEGLTYRIVPFKDTDDVTVNADLMYDNMMNKFRFGNIEDPKVYLDENILRMCNAQRQMFGRLIDELVEQKDSTRAANALAYSMEHIPGNTVPHSYSSVGFVESYYAINMNDKAREMGNQLADDAEKNLLWLSQFTGSQYASAMQDVAVNLATLQQLALIARDYDEEEFEKYYTMFMTYSKMYRK
ncbi:MAG: hypothetical protein IKS58_03640, partial [Paludibacteraceae bacterium]|nr:hypothetical protein [Paludibacteraceae bacterium]